MYFCFGILKDGVKNILLVFVGSGIGGAARYLLSLTFDIIFMEFPVATLIINAIACLVVGLVVGVADTRSILTSPQTLFLSTGFCGGFSTFSKFSGETIYLFQEGNNFMAILNIILSVAICLIATYVGLFISRFVG